MQKKFLIQQYNYKYIIIYFNFHEKQKCSVHVQLTYDKLHLLH